MAEWVYLIHPPRERFAETMTPAEAAARAVMEGDPVIGEGLATGELRQVRVSLLRGRDEAWVREELRSPPPG